MNSSISNTVLEVINDKLEEYKDILNENTLLYNQLKECITNSPQCINMELVSRLDDIIEDIVTMGVNCKLVLNSIRNNSALTISDREQDRAIRYNKLRELLPILFFMSQLGH